MGTENRKTNSTPKLRRDSCLALILKIAAAANVELSEASQAVYLEKLENLSLERMQAATDRTIDEWDKANQMPPLPFILARAQMPDPMITKGRQLLERGDKPPDWEPLASGELEEMRRDARKIEREIEVNAKQHEMPKPIDDVEWAKRRDEQLRRFLSQNKGAGEA